MKKLLYKYRKCSVYSFDDLFRSNTTFVTLNHFNDSMEGYIPYNKEKVYESVIGKTRFIKQLIESERNKIIFGENRINFYELSYEQQKEIVTSKSYKEKALNFIEEFARLLYLELRNSFLVSSFSEVGGHPVMWSHYADDSSGFVEEFNVDSLKSDYDAWINNTFSNIDSNQKKIFGLHKIIYGEDRKLDCTQLISQFLLLKFAPNKCVNRFMQYIKRTGDYESVLYVLTHKMKEWEYEKEWRLIIPKYVTNRKKDSQSIR